MLVLERKMHRIGLYGVVKLLVTSNPRFSVEKRRKTDDDDDDDE